MHSILTCVALFRWYLGALSKASTGSVDPSVPLPRMRPGLPMRGLGIHLADVEPLQHAVASSSCMTVVLPQTAITQEECEASWRTFCMLGAIIAA